MSPNRDDAIRLKLEIDIPTGVAPRVRRFYLASPPTVTTPLLNTNTKARWKNEANAFVICSTGTAPGARHLFAQVSNSDLTGNDPPNGCMWTRPTGQNGDWQFSHNNAMELPIHTLGVPNVLNVWADYGDSYSGRAVTFTPIDAGETECLGGSGSGSGSGVGWPPAPPALPLPPALAKWARMPRRLRFEVAAVKNLSCKRCFLLNGIWTLQFDDANPHRCRWYGFLPGDLFDKRESHLWRLQFQQDGNWYLDYVSNLEQAPGSFISYRRHESAWKVDAPNEMQLVTNGGLCDVPAKITIGAA